MLRLVTMFFVTALTVFFAADWALGGKLQASMMPRLLVVLALLSIFSFAVRPDAADSGRNTLLLYFAVAICYLYGMLDAFWLEPQHGPLMLCVLLAVSPTFMTDLYWRVALLPLAVTALFLALVPAFTPQLFWYDLKWTLLCCIVGLALGHHHITSKVKTFHLSDQLCHQRDTDSLTELLTRGAAEAMVRSVLELGDQPCTMMIMDVDDFKSLNDTYGHSFGDAVLETIGHLLRSSFRSTDYVCRLGGDEFMVFVLGNAEPEVAMRKAQGFLDALATAPTPGNKTLHPSMSIGVSLFPQQGTTFDDLYRRADHALYLAKRGGKNTCRLFNA